MQSTRPYGIKGVTDNARPPVIVKAKIGRKNEKGYPEKLDYISFVEPGEEGTPCQAFDVLGTRPQSFLGAFPSDETETFVDAAWKRYGKSGLKCRGDGEIGIDRETGEELQCAGEYSKDNPETHLCPYARPTEKTVNGVLKRYPPECKPTLSMRLVVPLAGSMGLVQLDTGGAASSVPTLWWQLAQLRRLAGGELAGVAVKVGIRPFTTKFGTSYAWHLENPTPEELEELKTQFALIAPARVFERAAAPKELPPMDETVEQDVYGLPDEALADERQIEPPVQESEPLPEAEPLPDEPYVADDPLDIGVPGEVVQAELAYKRVLAASPIPEAKKTAAIAVMEANRAKAEADGSLEAYANWLAQITDRVPRAAA